MIQTSPIISRSAKLHKTVLNSSGSDSGLKCKVSNTSWETTTSDSLDKSQNYSSDDEASQTQNNSKIRRKLASLKQMLTPKRAQKQKVASSNFDNRFSTQPTVYIDSSATSSMTNLKEAQKEYHEVEIPVGRFGNLGVTVIGQTTPDGHDVGIYCGGIISNSAAASLNGTIEVGDRIVMVDGEDLRDMPNDYAVEVLQQRVNNCLLGRTGRIFVSIGLAKYMDNQDSSDFSDSAGLDSSNDDGVYGLVKPINPAEWVANHEDFYLSNCNLTKIEQHPDSEDIITISEEGVCERESTYETLLYDPQVASHKKLLPNLSIQTSMRTMVKTAQGVNSGLKIRDRQWLRLVILEAFLGADLVDWLHENVTGLEDRRDAKSYAATLFKGQLVKPTIQAKPDKFSEKSYYKF